MKRVFHIAFAILTLAAAPLAHSQLRADAGAVAILGGGYISHGTNDFDAYFSAADRSYVPLFDGGLYLQSGAGPVRLAAGARIWSLLGLINIAYPSAKLEIDLGPLSVDAGIGGYWFGHWLSDSEPGLLQLDLLLPEASAWLAFGKGRGLRVGGGAVGLISTHFDFRTLPVLFYAGGRIVLD